MGDLVPSSRRLLPPDHRTRAVQLAALETDLGSKKPKYAKFKDPLMQDLYWICVEKPEKASDAVFHAALLDKIPYARAVMRAFLFCRTPLAAFLVATEATEEVIHAYGSLFFDVGVFPNRLIKSAYVQQLPDGTNATKYEKDLLTWGLQLGWEYLIWKVTGGKITMPAQEALQHIMTDALWRSREHIFNSLDDKRTREARAWIPQALKTAEALSKTDSGRVNSLEELRIRLVGIDTTLSEEDVDSDQILS